MAQVKKIVYGTSRGLETAIERYKANGWNVINTEVVPRGSAQKKFTYTAIITKGNVNLKTNESTT